MSRYDFHPLWLSDAIDRPDNDVPSKWCDAGLPKHVEKLLVTVEQVSDSLSGIVQLVEADELLVDADARGTFDYKPLSFRTRMQLFQACRCLKSYMTTEMAALARVEGKGGAA